MNAELYLKSKGLTNCEIEVAMVVSKGLSNRDAATELSVTVKTVKFHLYNIFRKLGLSSRAKLMVLCITPSGQAMQNVA